jgi:thiol-disulfide isomerase/thioredoxin
MNTPPRTCLKPLALLMLIVSSATPASAASPDASPRERLDAMIAAHRDADELIYRVDVELTAEDGRWETVNQTRYHVAWDRGRQALRLAHPAFDLEVRDGQMIVVSDQLPGRVLQTPVGTEVIWSSMTGAFPPLADMIPLPDLMLLTARDPFTRITDGAADARVASAEDGEGLRLNGGETDVTLTPDPQTRLLSRAEADVEVRPGVVVRVVHRVTPLEGKAAAADALAAIQPGGEAQVVDSFSAFVARGGGYADPAAAMVGKPAPAATFTTVDGQRLALADLEADVVVLDFWTTWCGPCLMAMPELVDFDRWVEQEGKSVAVLAVNVAEDPAQVMQLIDKQGWQRLDVVFDDGSAYQAFGGRGFPFGVVIADGKIVKASHGLVPGRYTESLQQAVRPYVD